MTRAGSGRPQMHFYRQFGGLTGGHVKVWHYFGHVAASGRFEPQVFFTPDSDLSAANPWTGDSPRILGEWRPHAADALFLGGVDWAAVPESADVPVLNLIQSVRHSFADDERYPFLRRRALRICLTDEIADALAETGIVNGPIVTVPIGVDAPISVPLAPWTSAARPVDVLIAGKKNPGAARALHAALAPAGLNVRCVTDNLPRADFLSLFPQSRVAVLLPRPAEGFFLPVLEAAAQGCAVVCPQVPGTSAYQDSIHALRPAFDVDALADAVHRALRLDTVEREAMHSAARRLIEEHSLERERQRVSELLQDFVTDW